MKRINDENINTPDYWDGIWRRELIVKGPVSDLGRWRAALTKGRRGDAVLDVACGITNLATYAIDNYDPSEIHGCDLSPFAIDAMRILEPRATWQQADIYRLPYPDNEFDLVVAAHCLVCMEAPARGIAEMLRVAKPVGWLTAVVGVPAVLHPERRKYSVTEFSQQDLTDLGFTEISILNDAFFIAHQQKESQ